MNDNGVPIRSIVLSIFDTSAEDSSLLGVSRNLDEDTGLPDGPYDFLGADADRTVSPNQRIRFAINYFRLGDLTNSQSILSNFQRRIVIANGSNRELLFSFTPVGTSDVVRPQIDAQLDTMLAAINSVTLAVEVEEIAPIEIATTSQVETDSFVIEFTNNPGATDFMVLGSPELTDENPQNLNEFTEVTEISEGLFRAVIDISAIEEPRMFFWISRGP